jgi:hypothetical protein
MACPVQSQFQPQPPTPKPLHPNFCLTCRAHTHFYCTILMQGKTKQMQHCISWACSDVLPEIWVTCLWSVSPNFNLLNKYVIHQNLLFVSVVALILYPTFRWTLKTWDLYKVKDALPASILLLGHPTSSSLRCSPLPHNPCNQTLCKPYSRPKWDWFQISSLQTIQENLNLLIASTDGLPLSWSIAMFNELSANHNTIDLLIVNLKLYITRYKYYHHHSHI